MNILLIYFLIAFVSLVAFFYFLSWLSKGKKKSQFDERQLLVRGNAFKYGFFTILLGNVVQIVITITEEDVTNLFYPSTIIVWAAGLCVYCVYAIWNDAYMGINENTKTYMIMNAFIGVANICIGIFNLPEDATPSNNGYISGLLNLLLGCVFVVMLITMVIKKLKDKSED